MSGSAGFDEATVYLDRLLALQPDDPHYLQDLGNTYLVNNEPDKALSVFQKAVELRGVGVDYHRLGSAYLANDEPREAVRAFNRAVELRGYAIDYYQLGNADLANDEPDDAFPAFQIAVEKRAGARARDFAMSLMELSFLLIDNDQPKEAIRYLRQAQQHGFNSPIVEADAHHLLGTALRQNGDPEGAFEEYSKATGTAPSHPGLRFILYDLACLEAVRGNTEEAVRWFEKAVDAGWNNVEHTESDPDLESLRNNARFQANLNRMKGSDPSLIN